MPNTQQQTPADADETQAVHASTDETRAEDSEILHDARGDRTPHGEIEVEGHIERSQDDTAGPGALQW